MRLFYWLGYFISSARSAYDCGISRGYRADQSRFDTDYYDRLKRLRDKEGTYA